MRLPQALLCATSPDKPRVNIPANPFHTTPQQNMGLVETWSGLLSNAFQRRDEEITFTTWVGVSCLLSRWRTSNLPKKAGLPGLRKGFNPSGKIVLVLELCNGDVPLGPSGGRKHQSTEKSTFLGQTHFPELNRGLFSFPKFWQTSFWLSCHPGRGFIIPVNTSDRTSLTSDFKHFLLTAGHPNVTGRLLHVTFSTPSDFLALVLNLIQLCSLTSRAENRRVSSKSKGYLKGREVSRKFQTAFLYYQLYFFLLLLQWSSV